MNKEEIIRTVSQIRFKTDTNNKNKRVLSREEDEAITETLNYISKLEKELEYYKEKEEAETDDFENRDRWE